MLPEVLLRTSQGRARAGGALEDEAAVVPPLAPPLVVLPPGRLVPPVEVAPPIEALLLTGAVEPPPFPVVPPARLEELLPPAGVVLPPLAELLLDELLPPSAVLLPP